MEKTINTLKGILRALHTLLTALLKVLGGK